MMYATYHRIRRQQGYWTRYHAFRAHGIGVLQALHWAA